MAGIPGSTFEKDGKSYTYSASGKSYSPTKDTNKVTAQYTPIEGENAGKRVSLIADGSKTTGITTSDKASNSVDQARADLNNLGSKTVDTTTGGGVQDQLSALFKQLSEYRTKLADAQEKEKKAKEDLTNLDLNTKLGGLDKSEEGGTPSDLSAGINEINKAGQGGAADTSVIQDPVLRAMTDATINTVTTVQAQMSRLNDFAKTMSEYSQAEVDDISATAVRAVERQVKENERVQRAMQFAGVISGRAQMAPTVEGTLIHEIIQDGLDEINIIEDKKTAAIRTARKAETEFNYKLFTESVDLAKEYNQAIEDGITKLKTEVRQAEKDEQDRTTFRQQQEERNSLILAEELIDATPEQIAETAAANGIDVGLLTKAVNDAKYTASDRSLSLEQQRASLSKTYNDIRLANEKEDKKIEIPKDVEQGFRSVARLSKDQSEAAWKDIQDFGLNGDTVQMWLEEGKSKAQVKSMVTAHEQSQQQEGEDKTKLPTATETALFDFIDKYETKAGKKATKELTEIVTKTKYKTTPSDKPKTPESKYGGSTLSSPETFFKQN